MPRVRRRKVYKQDRQLNENFFKFPVTPHLATLFGVEIRDDKVMTERERSAFLTRKLTVEEKVDGANLGISFDSNGNVRAQNRGGYLTLPGPGQWRKLWDWLGLRADTLFDTLMDRYVLFGEWCYARHSVSYSRLPDWFLGFDIYDRRSGRFLSVSRRDALCGKMGVAHVPFIARGVSRLKRLRAFSGSRRLRINRRRVSISDGIAMDGSRNEPRSFARSFSDP